jgi:hypothetical protein
MTPNARPDATPADESTPMWLLALLLALTFAFFVPAATWSPMSRFGVTRALVEERSVQLGAWAHATGDRSRRDDAWYSDKAPLPAVMATLPYTLVRTVHRIVGRDEPAFEARSLDGVPAVRVTLNRSAQQLLYASTLGTSGLAGVLVGLWSFVWLRRRFSSGASMLASLVIVLGSPLFPYSTSLFGHTPAAAALLGALCFGEPRAPRRRLVLSGALLALAVGCEYLTAIPAIVLGAYLALAQSEGPFDARSVLTRVGRLALGALPLALVVGAYHHVAFGAFWSTGYSHLTNATFTAGHARGLMGIGVPSPSALFGLLFGTERGLLYLAPVLAIAIVGIAWRWRSLDGSAKAGVAAFLVLLLANAGYYMWWGGAATGPRHLVPVLPFLAPGLAVVWEARRARLLLLVAAFVSALNMLAFTAVGIEAPERREVLFGYAWSNLIEGRVASLSSATNLGLMLGLPATASLGLLWAVWVIFARWLWRSVDPATPSASPTEPTAALDTPP